MTKIKTKNSININFHIQQTSFNTKNKTKTNINTQTTNTHNNLNPNLTLTLFNKKHPKIYPIFTITTKNFQTLQTTQNNKIFISPTTLTLTQNLHKNYIQIKNPNNKILLSNFITTLKFPKFTYKIIIQYKINYKKLTS